MLQVTVLQSASGRLLLPLAMEQLLPSQPQGYLNELKIKQKQNTLA